MPAHGTERSSAFEVPENLGCNPDCSAGKMMADILKSELTDGTSVAEEVVAETQALLQEHNCQALKDGVCIMAKYAVENTIGYRVAFETVELVGESK